MLSSTIEVASDTSWLKDLDIPEGVKDALNPVAETIIQQYLLDRDEFENAPVIREKHQKNIKQCSVAATHLLSCLPADESLSDHLFGQFNGMRLDLDMLAISAHSVGSVGEASDEWGVPKIEGLTQEYKQHHVREAVRVLSFALKEAEKRIANQERSRRTGRRNNWHRERLAENLAKEIRKFGRATLDENGHWSILFHAILSHCGESATDASKTLRRVKKKFPD